MYKHSFALLALLAATVSAHDFQEVGDDLEKMGQEIEDMGDDLVAWFNGFIAEFGDGGSADPAMLESLKNLQTLEDMTKVFCQEEGEGRRLDGHEEGEAVAEAAEGESSGVDKTPDELCIEARTQFADAVRSARAAMEETSSSMEDSFNEIVSFLSNDSTFYYVGAATMSAAATLAF